MNKSFQNCHHFTYGSHFSLTARFICAISIEKFACGKEFFVGRRNLSQSEPMHQSMEGSMEESGNRSYLNISIRKKGNYGWLKLNKIFRGYSFHSRTHDAPCKDARQCTVRGGRGSKNTWLLQVGQSHWVEQQRPLVPGLSSSQSWRCSNLQIPRSRLLLPIFAQGEQKKRQLPFWVYIHRERGLFQAYFRPTTGKLGCSAYWDKLGRFV